MFWLGFAAGAGTVFVIAGGAFAWYLWKATWARG